MTNDNLIPTQNGGKRPQPHTDNEQQQEESKTSELSSLLYESYAPYITPPYLVALLPSVAPQAQTANHIINPSSKQPAHQTRGIIWGMTIKIGSSKHHEQISYPYYRFDINIAVHSTRQSMFWVCVHSQSM